MRDPESLTRELYAELRASAARLVRRHTGSVAPSSLVQEAVGRLWRAQSEAWEDEAHFRATAALAMRQVLIDRARARLAVRRGGDQVRVDDSPSQLGAFDGHAEEIVALDAAIAALEAERPRAAEIVVLRVLGGLSVEEIAAMLEISDSTVKREWRVGRAWLAAQLDGAATEG